MNRLHLKSGDELTTLDLGLLPPREGHPIRAFAQDHTFRYLVLLQDLKVHVLQSQGIRGFDHEVIDLGALGTKLARRIMLGGRPLLEVLPDGRWLLVFLSEEEGTILKITHTGSTGTTRMDRYNISHILFPCDEITGIRGGSSFDLIFKTRSGPDLSCLGNIHLIYHHLPPSSSNWLHGEGKHVLKQIFPPIGRGRGFLGNASGNSKTSGDLWAFSQEDHGTDIKCYRVKKDPLHAELVAEVKDTLVDAHPYLPIFRGSRHMYRIVSPGNVVKTSVFSGHVWTRLGWREPLRDTKQFLYFQDAWGNSLWIRDAVVSVA